MYSILIEIEAILNDTSNLLLTVNSRQKKSWDIIYSHIRTTNYVCFKCIVCIFQIMVERKLHWIRGHGSAIPPDAVPAGRTRTGEQLYIGRAKHTNATIVGKVS